ncbi:MAG: hypothetical protein ACTSXP_15560, partial [Promethearchaeota archaeon]
MHAEITNFIKELINCSELNRLPSKFNGGLIFSDVLVGVASADDQLFKKLKEIIAPEYMTPVEMWLASGMPKVKDPEQTIKAVSFVLSFSDEIRDAGKAAEGMPPDIYCIGRNYANEFIADTMKKLVEFFKDKGYNAMASQFSKNYNIIIKKNMYSTW